MKQQSFEHHSNQAHSWATPTSFLHLLPFT